MYSSFNNIFSEKYIPEPLYYNVIERNLNDYTKVPAYRDKNNHYKFLPQAKLPTPVLKNINGKYFSGDNKLISIEKAVSLLKNNNNNMIIKPSLDTGGGRGVSKIQGDNHKIYLDSHPIEFEGLLEIYKKNFIVQEIVCQHDSLKRIYPDSLNTIRLMTVRLNSGYHCVSAVVRFGNNGSIVDNIKANGGIACGISQEGNINSYGINSLGEKKYKHPFTDIRFENQEIYRFSDIKKEVEMLHNDLPYFDLVSWDVALDSEGNIIIIEFNISGQEINFHQFNNGPLFGEYTDEIMNRITK